MKLFLTAAFAAALSSAQATCDRACLIRMVDTYLAAVVAHDAKKAPLADGVKIVENSVRIKVGEGLWKSATAPPTTFKIYVPDPVSQEVGFIGVMEESGKPMELGLRLRVRNKLIVEAEHLKTGTLRETSVPNLRVPRPHLLATVPVAERSTREYMLNAGLSYYDAIVNSMGSLAPFADDCVRRENGMQTNFNDPPPTPGPRTLGSLRCAAQLDTRTMSYIKAINNRRVHIADPQTGLVFGLSHFRHPMLEKTLRIVGVPGVTENAVNFNPFDLPAAHIFKIQGGKIHEIEAMGYGLPYNAKTGWE